jgi:hypothetical protein
MLADRHDGQLQGRSVSKLLAGRIDIAVAYGTSCNRWMPRCRSLQSQVVALRQPRWLIGDFYLGFSRKAMPTGRIDAYVGALRRFRQTRLTSNWYANTI